MKKLINGAGALLIMFAVLPGAATAMEVASQASGQQINGWFKDSFSVAIKYGNGTCTGPGHSNIFNYQSGAGQDGVHQYYFISDAADNPYLSFDSGPPRPLISPLPCPIAFFGSFKPERLLIIQLDSLPPDVSITSPSGNAATNLGSYSISGTANDSSSGIQSVQLLINNIPGPDANVSGNTFSASAPLTIGNNTIQAVALDNVGHRSTSNSVVIVRSSQASNGSGTTTAPPIANSQSSNPATSTTAPAQQATKPAIAQNGQDSVKYNQAHLLNLTNDYLDQPSDPNIVLSNSGFSRISNRVFYGLVTLLLILISIILFIVWRFRPIFTKLDKGNSGLRRRIIIIVTLPSLLPLFGLGFLGYQQLSNSLRSSVSQELSRAAQTSAIKLEREFSIRRKVITTTASNVVQIKSQFQDQYGRLLQQKSTCAGIMQNAIPAGHYNQVTESDNCLPFISALAQLTNPTASRINIYLQTLDDGYGRVLVDMQADEQQRINSLLAVIRNYFPETTEMAIIDNSKPAKTLAMLPDSTGINPITKLHNDLLKQSAQAESIVIFDKYVKPNQILFSYPITSADKKLAGNAIVSFNTDYPSFIPAIWSATPKPYAQDKVYLVNDKGDQIYPVTSQKLTAGQAVILSATPPAKLVNISSANQNLATRVSQVKGTNWTVAVGAPPKTILAPIAGVQRTAILAIICFLLLSLLLGIFYVSGIASEIETLFRGALQFAKGELGYKIKLSSRDELHVLGDTMNQMASDIKTAQTALIEKDKEFISIATHELKAPMTAILGNLSMITEDGVGKVDDKAHALIDQAYLGTVRLRDIVTDMLDIARLESGKAQLNFEAVDITGLTRSILDMQATPAKQAGLKLNYAPDESLPKVMADQGKLQIIMTNFVSNAIKYNRPNGAITISHALNNDSLITSISDSGLGIPLEQQPHIFEKFYRVSHEDRANIQGTGLGMHITKRFIEAMGGTVWFTSAHGEGTTFYFSLPLVNQSMPSPTEPATDQTLIKQSVLASTVKPIP